VKPILGRFYEHTYALLRIFAGLMFMFHGTQKILGWPAGGQGRPPIASIGGISGLLELILGAMIAVGLLTTVAAFLASGEMAVAYWMVHAKGGLLPNVNGGEVAVLYCFVFLFIAANDGGDWSLDHMLFGHAKSRAQTAP
jgi:putative oxidoreductase